MGLLELNTISSRSLFNKLEGYKNRLQREHRTHWEHTRLVCFYSFSPIDPADPKKETLMPIQRFMPFDWEDDVDIKDAFADLKALAEDARKKAKENWQRLDKKLGMKEG